MKKNLKVPTNFHFFLEFSRKITNDKFNQFYVRCWSWLTDDPIHFPAKYVAVMRRRVEAATNTVCRLMSTTSRVRLPMESPKLVRLGSSWDSSLMSESSLPEMEKKRRENVNIRDRLLYLRVKKELCLQF